MQKVRLQILKQVNDHEGPCHYTDNEYFEQMLVLTVDVPEEYKKHETGTVILNHSWKKELATLVPKVNKGDTQTCFIGTGGKYDLKVHDYKLTVINAVIVKI
jgi:hypothetical protein